MTSERSWYVTYNSTERTFPEQPKAPQLGKNEILAQHNAQHKINLDSSTASLLPMAMDQCCLSKMLTVPMVGWIDGCEIALDCRLQNTWCGFSKSCSRDT
jgi:hypothetical protein